MRIDNEIKIDFNDVLILPKRSTLVSRNDVDLFRQYKFKHHLTDDSAHYDGIAIMAANMDGIGTIQVADALASYGLFTTLVKTYDIPTLIDFFNKENKTRIEHTAMSIGITDSDLNKFRLVYNNPTTNIKYVCIDVANGYTQNFVEFVKKFRGEFPDVVVIAGNVVTGEMTEELILSGADVVKIGIGQGSLCFHSGTKVTTITGSKNIEDIEVGDMVLTHLNRYRSVKNIFKNKTKEMMIVNGIKCTPNHKFYVVNKSDAEKVTKDNYHYYAYWLEACKIRNDHLLVRL